MSAKTSPWCWYPGGVTPSEEVCSGRDVRPPNHVDCECCECAACMQAAAEGAAQNEKELHARQSHTADIVAYVVEQVLKTHERAGTDLKSHLEGIALNYRAREPHAMRFVREALAHADLCSRFGKTEGDS